MKVGRSEQCNSRVLCIFMVIFSVYEKNCDISFWEITHIAV